MPDTVELVAREHVATLTLLEKTMTPGFFEELGEAVAAVERDPAHADVRALVICAREPKGFSFGLDLPKAFAAYGELFRGASAAQRAGLHRLIGELQRPFDALFRLRVPTICALHGWCIGGGLDLASACDLRVAAADTKISLRETKIAIVADLGSLQRLPPIIGQGRTRELAFTGRDVTADEALAMGLVNSVHADSDATLEHAHTLARQIAENPPRTVEGAKVMLNAAIAPEIDAGLARVASWNAAFLPSEDLAEAVSAFASRRPPKFKGR